MEPTRIPKAFWKTEVCPAPGDVRPSFPLSKDRMVTFDEDQHNFVTVSFPSAYPVSRKEVQELIGLFDQMFASAETADGAHARLTAAVEAGDVDEILGILIPQTKALDAMLHETMRQVSTQCTDRGNLLRRVLHHQDRIFGESAMVVRELGKQLALEQAKNKEAGIGEDDTTAGSQAMCDKLMGIVNGMVEERDGTAQRLKTLEEQLRVSEATLERIMQEQREKMDGGGVNDSGDSFFMTGSKDKFCHQPSQRELELEEKVQVLESQLRTYQEVSETHVKTYLSVERMRTEKIDMEETVRELTKELERLSMFRNPRCDQETQKPGLESVPPSRQGVGVGSDQGLFPNKPEFAEEVMRAAQQFVIHQELFCEELTSYMKSTRNGHFEDFAEWLEDYFGPEKRLGSIHTDELLEAARKYQEEEIRRPVSRPFP